MSASSLPRIEGLCASGLGLRDGFRSTMNGFVGWRMVGRFPPGDESQRHHSA